MPYKIPIGPYHPALDEPYKLTVSCKGETVQSLNIEIGFVLRSVELLAQQRNYIQDIVLVEHICGLCSNMHAIAFAMAAEEIAGIRIPARAEYIRTIMAELERLHSHLLWAGVGSMDIGFKTMFMEIYHVRERVMDVLEAISGNRVHYGVMCIGGVCRDITDRENILSGVQEIKRVLEKDVIPIFTKEATIKTRIAGIGVLSREDALNYGVVGPTARASGLANDIRQDFPSMAYQELGFKIVTLPDGDIRARIMVRAMEMLESVRLIELALQQLPETPLRIEDPMPNIPPGEATVRVEAPRGELFYYLKSDGSNIPSRVKIRTPSFVNIPAIEAMAVGQPLADMPLIQASVDPCCSCTDR
jgi:Ni,Fe-hydrogenase III large subunit